MKNPKVENEKASQIPVYIVDALETTVFSDEKIVDFLEHGAGEQKQTTAIILTDKRVITYKSGPFASKTMFGRGQKIKVYPYNSIKGVEFSVSKLYCRIDLTIPGVADAPSGGIFIHAARRDNVAAFGNAQADRAKEIASYISDMIMKAQLYPTATSPIVSISDSLSMLAELHRSGALTEDEFKAAKSKLL